jgi:hypothetical protein
MFLVSMRVWFLVAASSLLHRLNVCARFAANAIVNAPFAEFRSALARLRLADSPSSSLSSASAPSSSSTSSLITVSSSLSAAWHALMDGVSAAAASASLSSSASASSLLSTSQLSSSASDSSAAAPLLALSPVACVERARRCANALNEALVEATHEKGDAVLAAEVRACFVHLALNFTFSSFSVSGIQLVFETIFRSDCFDFNVLYSVSGSRAALG